jgi:glutamate dehydrogenase
MPVISVDSKVEFQAGLSQRLKTKGEAVRIFSGHFFADRSLVELDQGSWADIVAKVESSWAFFRTFNGQQSQVRVIETDSHFTIVEVASSNLPFLLDSLRMELSRMDLVLRDVQQCLLGVVRGGRKLVLDNSVTPNESLIRLELEGTGASSALKQNFHRIIRLVSQVVVDFVEMRKQLLLWSDDPSSADHANEDSELLRWFYGNNFTFLGYEEYEPVSKGRLQLVKESRLGLARPQMTVDGLPLQPPIGRLRLEKLPVRSRVHRPAYLDGIIVAERKDGRLLRVCRFVGLFTSTVYNQRPTEIPLVRQKLQHIFDFLDIAPTSHKGRELSRIMEILPREELIYAEVAELQFLVTEIYALQERRIVRALARQDDYFANCIVYVPKDAYDTELRVQIQDILVNAFAATDVEFSTFFSESALIRTHFVMRIPNRVEVDLEQIEAEILTLTRSWPNDLEALIYESEEQAVADRLWRSYRKVFSPGYQADYSVKSAYRDLRLIDRLTSKQPLSLKLYRSKGAIHFKLIHKGGALPLSDVIPILENLGAKTLEQHPYGLKLRQEQIWVHDFVLQFTTPPESDFQDIKRIFEQAFQAIWRGGKENDSFNRLVPAATMHHRQIAVIRTYARYYGQLQNANSQQFIADCVTRYAYITRMLYELFETRFDPEQADRNTDALKKKLFSHISEDVANLADDRVLRGLVEIIEATQRTNFYQATNSGEAQDYISLKIHPREISEMPEPKPAFEIFVYSARFEGVHLRGGKIARGGLRWSDRSEDYRTEVLGLMKAQQVKNSVIVPVGAKGGFLPKQLPEASDRDAYLAEGIACYRMFIQGLLDVTDNLVKGKVVHPRQVICHDDDDTYLVVAADKGTATFSDIANEISIQNGFWLGDAFASGGSVGYDHKAMGITAKGAWRSVQQHFREKGVDTQVSEFTVVGVGDMSGDVFGNGMLLSDKICLVGAFNHMHIFIDPKPNSAKSFNERQRLFSLPRSSWSDYKASVISKGGGIFSRSVKSIPVSPEMKTVFGLKTSTVTPNQLMTAMLKSQVDLFWNGGIGTYVKGKHESHLEVADKSNDAIRINGEDLRCKVVGEGGNLGMTQRARIEYCLKGGECFTDFIDNAGGVNCSDAEVNIKILLNQLLEKRGLTVRSRSDLLLQMTDAVGEIVLDNNYDQALAVNLMMHQIQKRDLEYGVLLKSLEEAGKINRQLEFLPSDDEIQERHARGDYLTSPEVSVLTSYVKGDLKEVLAASPLLDVEYMAKEMMVAFPRSLIKKYSKELRQHRLHRELASTQIANGMVNLMGMNFVARMEYETGCSPEKIARAFLVARDIFEIPEYWAQICALDYHVDPAVQKVLMLDLIRLVRRTTRWLLRNRRRTEKLEAEITNFRKGARLISKQLEPLLNGDQGTLWQNKVSGFEQAGVPTGLARYVAAAHHLYSALGIVEASSRSSASLQRVAQVFFALGHTLQLNWFSQRIHEFQADTRWQALARETLQDDLNWQQIALTLGIVGGEGKSKRSAVKMIEAWLSQHEAQVNRWLSLQHSMRSAGVLDPSVFTVGIRELLDLAQSSAGARNRF